MKKVALLIGVSEYKNFTRLPSAVNDVDALQQVLLNPEMGGFDEVKPFKNINRQEIENEIFKLFDSRKSDELLLFYFSGHGITNPKGNLFIATRETDKNEREIVIPPTAVEASYLQKRMNESRSQHQVIILDCCYSGAFDKELNPKDGGKAPIDFKQDLGGKGRAILTSSSSTQKSYESKSSGLSIYTKYLVEGIRTGAADRDNDGIISVDELHEYAREKVQEESPAMTPRFLPVEQGYRIYIARSPQDDPQLKYRKEVEAIIQNDRGEIDFLRGEINDFERECLEIHRLELDLSIEDAQTIENEVMEPHCQRCKKLQQYEKLFSKAVEKSFPLRENDRRNLERIQKRLSLRDEDVRWIEAKIALEFDFKLKSKAEVDYAKLQELLRQGKWEEADQETLRIMFQTMRKEADEWVDSEDIQNFPSEDLRIIDQLWVKYSKGFFGFSIQKEIYLDCEKKTDMEYLSDCMPGSETIGYEFSQRVGWLVNDRSMINDDNLEPNTLAPKGHFPREYFLNERTWVEQDLYHTFHWDTLFSRRDL